MSRKPPPTQLSPGGRRALSAFLEGRLPAGRLHEELQRGVEPPPALLPVHTASIPVPPPVGHAA